MKATGMALLAMVIAFTPASAARKGPGGPGDPPPSVAAALAFLEGRQSAGGLVDSFAEDDADLGYTYDNALAATAYIAGGDLTSAGALLDTFAAIGAAPDGGFLHRYRASDGGPADGLSGVGHNAYLLQAIARYIAASGDTSHDAMAVGIADFLLGHQDADGGLFGRAGATWKSTENNLAAYAALHNAGTVLGIPEYIDRARSIRDFLVAECWDGTRFLTGENDPMVVTDAQALGVMALGPAYQSGAYWVEDHTLTTRRYRRGQKVTGFDLNTDRDTVWTEGTLLQALAFAVAGDASRSDGYRLEAEKLFQSSGAFLQASNTGTTGFGDSFHAWQAAAPTAWYVLAASGYNMLEPLP